MQINKTHLFRSEAPPWYRSTPILLLAALVLAALIGLGAIGVQVAIRQPVYRDFMWVPLLLVFCSGYLFIAVCLRLARRWSSGAGS
ncbi:MAG: hypothetical protein K9K62_09395 [Desulfobacteraceae bacterium]|nr:hypothetical protein [Desulfobacteraceae bacterium]